MGKQKQATKGTGWTGEGYPFRTLPDYLQPGLDLVFVGINPGLYSVQRRHYFARLTSRFWTAFSASKLSERVRRALGTDTLRAEHDAELLRFGIGFTDVVKRPSANAADLYAVPNPSPANDHFTLIDHCVVRPSGRVPGCCESQRLSAIRASGMFGLSRVDGDSVCGKRISALCAPPTDVYSASWSRGTGGGEEGCGGSSAASHK